MNSVKIEKAVLNDKKIVTKSGDIDFSAVTFRYRDNKKIQICFKICKKTKSRNTAIRNRVLSAYLFLSKIKRTLIFEKIIYIVFRML